MYKNRLRVRVNGILSDENRLLLVHIGAPTTASDFWMPPGGGVEFGEPLQQALIREMKEESGLIVEPGSLLYVSEYIKNEWHAVEFYFRCRKTGGSLNLGSDPEHSESDQMLKDIGFFSPDEANQMQIYPPFIRKDFAELAYGKDHPTKFTGQ